MRPLIRSWTRQPVAVSIELYQSPVILYDQSDDISATPSASASVNYIGAAVIVDTAHDITVGGITLIRQVLLRRKKPKSKEWTDWVELQRGEYSVVGECNIEGKQRFDAYLPTPCRLPETRYTTYDQVVHLLTAIVHDLSPIYTALTTDPTRFEEDDELSDFPGSQPRKGVHAVCHLPIDVVHCPSLRGDIPQLECEQIVRLSDSGKVNIKAASQLFVLGSNLDLALDFHNLTADTTIHAISVILIQETFAPAENSLPETNGQRHAFPPAADDTPPVSDNEDASPSRITLRRRRRRPVLSRLSNMWQQFKEKPPLPRSSVIDEYALLSEGVHSIYTTPGSSTHGFLWRGEAGRTLDARRTAQNQDEYVDDAKGEHVGEDSGAEYVESTTSTFRFHRRVRLPSEINGAHHSTSTVLPGLAAVSHRLTVDIIYSILGQDEIGQKHKVEGEAEGSMRRLTTKFEIELPPCTLTPHSVQPPSYVTPESIRRISQDFPRGRSPGRLPSIRSTDRSPDIPLLQTPFTANTLNRQLSGISHFTSRSDHTPCPPEIAHSRAFRASNGRVIAPKRVFYSENDLRLAGQKHRKERAHCACSMSQEEEGRKGANALLSCLE